MVDTQLPSKEGCGLKDLFEPSSFKIDLENGLLVGGSGSYQKKFADLAGLYGDADAYDAMRPEWSERVVYEVTEFRPNERAGDLIFGVTRMRPGKVGSEYFLTRGHIHRQSDRPEIYYGQKGAGLMLMESPEGEHRAVAVDPGTVCYVPPYWIHRSVNVGREDLVMLFCYPADSGQDYSCIAKVGGMKVRIVDDGAGGWRETSNNAWRPRESDGVAALYDSQNSGAS